MADTPYLIKKYANRRLYDVAAGRFVTVAEIDHIIRAGHDIQVTDADGKDITRTILLQILTEREESGEPILSVATMHDMVRMYGNVMQGPFGQYIESGMAMLRKQRQAWGGMFQSAMREGAPAAMTHLVEQQMDLWKQSQDAFGRMFGGAPAPSGSRAKTPQDGDDKS